MYFFYNLGNCAGTHSLIGVTGEVHTVETGDDGAADVVPDAEDGTGDDGHIVGNQLAESFQPGVRR